MPKYVYILSLTKSLNEIFFICYALLTRLVVHSEARTRLGDITKTAFKDLDFLVKLANVVFSIVPDKGDD